MLGRMEMSVDNALGQYDIVGKEVFAKPRFPRWKTARLVNAVYPKYPKKNIEATLQKVIGDGLKTELQQRNLNPKGENKVLFEKDHRRCRTYVNPRKEPSHKGY
jgi:hypothetical protein